MGRMNWLFAGLVAATLAATGGRAAHGHDYRLLRKGQKPNEYLLIPEILGTHYFGMRVGETATITVANNNDPPCTALITCSVFDGTTATITPATSGKFVLDQPFTVTAKSRGPTTFRFHVKGEFAKPGGRAECDEDKDVDVVVLVGPNPFVTEFDAGKFGLNVGKQLKLDLSTIVPLVKKDVATIRAEVKAGEHTPSQGVIATLERYFAAQKVVTGLHENAVSDLRTGFVGLLNRDGYTPDCEPRGFGPGSHGVWSNSMRSIASLMRGINDRLEDGLARDISGFEKAYNSESRPFLVNWDYCCGDRPHVRFPTTSVAFGTGGGNGGGLDFYLAAGIARSVSPGFVEGHVWAAGCADPTKGNVVFDLLSGDGFTTSQTLLPAQDGTWRVQFDGLKTGFAYQLKARYESSMSGYGEKLYIGVPWARTIALQ